MVTDWRVSRSFVGLGSLSRRTNRVGRGLSLNRSQSGDCSTKYDRKSKSDPARQMAVNRGFRMVILLHTLTRTRNFCDTKGLHGQLLHTDWYFGKWIPGGIFSWSLHSWLFTSLGLTVILPAESHELLFFFPFLSLIQYNNKLRVALGPYIWWILK